MYITPIATPPAGDDFDWDSYVSCRRQSSILDGLDYRGLLDRVRTLLAEDSAAFALSLTRLLRALLSDTRLVEPRIRAKDVQAAFRRRRPGPDGAR